MEVVSKDKRFGAINGENLTDLVIKHKKCVCYEKSVFVEEKSSILGDYDRKTMPENSTWYVM